MKLSQWILPFMFFLSLSSIVSPSAMADELHLPLALFRALGYQPFTASHPNLAQSSLVPNQTNPGENLPWPVKFQDGSHTIAQNYVNFQDYSNSPYFHKGCDLRAQGNSDVTAPISGTLEGGYYGYADRPDGSEEKQWKPWNGQTHADPYFELAVISDDGYRFELHHIDSEKLPQTTIDALNRGHTRVIVGTIIGKVNGWAFQTYDYDHIHYNIYNPEGVPVNPEAFSSKAEVPDHTAPMIHGVYAVAASDGHTFEIKSGETVLESVQSLVVATTESRDQDAYVQTTPYLGVKFTKGSAFAWDFRKILLGPDGKWPNIHAVFADQVTAADGSTIENFGQFGRGMFLMKLTVEPSDHGSFEITASDTAGNETHFSAILK